MKTGAGAETNSFEYWYAKLLAMDLEPLILDLGLAFQKNKKKNQKKSGLTCEFMFFKIEKINTVLHIVSTRDQFLAIE